MTDNPSTIGISLFFPPPLGVEVAATPLEVLVALLVDALEPALPVDVDVVVGIVVPALKPGSELVLEPVIEVILDIEVMLDIEVILDIEVMLDIEVTLPEPEVIVVKTPPWIAAGAEALITVFEAWSI